MLKIESIEIEAFRSVERFIVDDLPLNGMIGIDGPSGSGKSTLLNAVAFILGISPYSAASQQNIFTKKPMQVVLNCIDDKTGQKIVIARGKKNYVFDGKQTIEGAAAVESYVMTLFANASKKIRQALTHRRQRDKGMFVGMDPTERQQFLSKIIGLDELEATLEKLKKDKKLLKDRVGSAETFTKIAFDTLPPEPKFNATVSVLFNGEKYTMDQFDAKLQELQATATYDELILAQKRVEFDKESAEIRADFESKLEALTKTKAVHQLELDRLKTLPHDSDTQSKIDANNKEIEDIREVRNEAIKRGNDADNVYEKELFTLRGEKSGLDAKVASIASFKKLIEKSEAEVKSLQADLRVLEGNECPTCHQNWETDDCLKKKQEIEAKIFQASVAVTTHTAAMHECEASKLKVEEVSVRIAEKLKQQQTTRDSWNQVVKMQNRKIDDLIASNTKLVDGSRDKKQNLIINVQHEITQIERQLTELRQDWNRREKVVNDKRNAAETLLEIAQEEATEFLLSVKRAREDYARFEKNHKEDVERYEKRKAEYQAESDKLAILNSQITVTDDSIAVLRGYLNAVTEEILNDITVETNSILRRLRNVGTTTVRFTVEESIRAGQPVYSIGIIVERDGATFDFDANLSGGQQASLELAIDLAIVTVLSNRQAGRVPGWMLIDEAFEGHEPATKEGCMEVLQVFAQNRQVFVIDHASELKEYYACKIKTNFDGQLTQYEVIR